MCIRDRAEAGSDLSLKQVKYLADMIGNPENKSRIIHIAGTNGKGSVGNFIAGILAMSGYTVGRYVSPAPVSYTHLDVYKRQLQCNAKRRC